MREFLKVLLAYVFIALLLSIPMAFIYVAARVAWEVVLFLWGLIA